MQGVLALAAAVVGALEVLFPTSIDRLLPDTGVFAGPCPLVVPGPMSPDDLIKAMLDQGASFGARQVNIVAALLIECAFHPSPFA